MISGHHRMKMQGPSCQRDEVFQDGSSGALNEAKAFQVQGPVPWTGHRPLKPALGTCQVLSYLSFGCKCPQRVDPPFKKVQISGSNKQPRLPESPFNRTLKNRLWKVRDRHVVSQAP